MKRLHYLAPEVYWLTLPLRPDTEEPLSKSDLIAPKSTVVSVMDLKKGPYVLKLDRLMIIFIYYRDAPIEFTLNEKITMITYVLLTSKR